MSVASSASHMLTNTAALAKIKEKDVIQQPVSQIEAAAALAMTPSVRTRVGPVDLFIPSTRLLVPNAPVVPAAVVAPPATGEYSAWTLNTEISESFKTHMRACFKQKPGHPDEIKITAVNFT